MVEAWKWLTLIANCLRDQDCTVALSNRTRIEKDLNAAGLVDARPRVAEWQPHK